MNLARTERTQLCELFHQVGPAAPTLCEGWQTHDLAAHLWVRENDPAAAVGVVSAFAAVTERRMSRARDRWSYDELVDRLAQGPAPWSLFRLEPIDKLANTVEYWVHHEDVRRAGDSPAGPRISEPGFEAQVWKQLGRFGKAMFGKLGEDGLVLENLQGDRIRIRPGDRTVTIAGPPTELLLYGFGRCDAAWVDIIGEPAPLAELPSAFGESASGESASGESE